MYKKPQSDGTPERLPNSGMHERLAGSVGLVMLVSTLARGLSLVASMRYTSWFGYTLETDVYSYAINLPNLIFTCVGTALATVVIPIFAGRLAAGERDRAYGFIDNILTISLIITAAIAAAGIFASPLIIRMIPKFRDGDPSLALFAIQLMFPVMMFHAVNYILQGVLQTNERYLLPAAVSAASGLSVIMYVSIFAVRFGIRGLLVATFVGLAAQALTLIPPVAHSLKYRYRPSLRLSDDDVRLAGKLALPVLVSSSSYQFNMFMNATFAARFDGGVLTITNMQTLAFTASQLFIISALSVYFPKMSAKYAVGDSGGFRATLYSVFRLIVVFAIPASAALAFLSRLLIPLLYGHGKVTASDIGTSVAVFAVYAGAIASMGLKEAADRAFYAARDSRTPAAVSVLIMAANIALSLLLMRRIGLVGLPVAYIIAMTVGAAVLLLILFVRMKTQNITAHAPILEQASKQNYTAHTPVPAPTPMFTPTPIPATILASTPAPIQSPVTEIVRPALGKLVFKCAIAVGFMLVALVGTEMLLNTFFGGYAQTPPLFGTAFGLPVVSQVARLGASITIGGAAYATAAYVLGIDEIRTIFKRIFMPFSKTD